MREARVVWGRLLVAALLLVAVGALSGCASLQGARLGPEPKSGAEQLVFDEQLVRLKGEAGAVAALVGAGVPQAQAQKRVLAATVAMGGK